MPSAVPNLYSIVGYILLASDAYKYNLLYIIWLHIARQTSTNASSADSIYSFSQQYYLRLHCVKLWLLTKTLSVDSLFTSIHKDIFIASHDALAGTKEPFPPSVTLGFTRVVVQWYGLPNSPPIKSLFSCRFCLRIFKLTLYGGADFKVILNTIQKKATSLHLLSSSCFSQITFLLILLI